MYHQGAQAYQQTAKIVETARDREAALLMKSAMGMQRVRDEWPATLGELNSALTYNRKIWTIFMSAAVKEDNPLPKPLRQNIANLGIYILGETRELLLMQTNNPKKLDTLININRQLAAGLRASP